MEYNILLVDDDQNVLAGLRRLLHGKGFCIRCATSADEALKLLRSTPIHLVISDQVMPGMSGTEFLQQVQSLFPNIVRFLLTGYATVEMIVEALNKGGIERVYLKPCKPEDLARGIHEVLQKHALLAQALTIIENDRKRPKENHRKQPGSDASPTLSTNVPEIVLEETPFGWNTLVRKLEKFTKDKERKA
jgi:DNA-binding NtrC family response regulator